MSNLKKMFERNKPMTAMANLKGGDKTPIEADGGLDLSADEARLERARGGKLNIKPYTQQVTDK